MKKTALLLAVAVSLSLSAQETAPPIRFEVKFSKPLAVVEFLQKLSPRAPDNSMKALFNRSEFNTSKYNGLIASFDSIPLDYTYDFPEYPGGQKIGGSTESTLKRMT